MTEPIRFYLGDELKEVRAAAPTRTVLEYLREDLGCTGTKEGCAEGDCGACTVVLGERDGNGIRYRAVNACIQLLPTLDGRQLLTVEHLADKDGALHPVQRAMMEHHGSQCGFCTPGFVMSLYALYESKRQRGASEIRSRLAQFVAQTYSAAPETVAIADGLVTWPDGEMTFADLVKKAYYARVQLWADGFYKTPKIHYDKETLSGRPFYYFAYGAACSEVAIDTLTGEMKVLRADLLHDVGRSINPAVDIGQIEGGFIQGMGWLTSEELVWYADGRLATHAPSTYKIPVASDIPRVFNVARWDGANVEPTVYRSKAVGEPPLMLAISVWEAIRDAIAGVADDQRPVPLNAPATPEEILRAVQAMQGAKNGV
jgi:aerobic-type carbon monoxide dehydrogenase small subunit (CoxS/CutS family)